MRVWIRKLGAGMAMLAMGLVDAPALFAQSSGQAAGGQNSAAGQQGGYVLHMNADLVLTNVVARDAKTGELVLGLKESDFSVFENGKQQPISSFDFESVDKATPLNEATISGLAAGTSVNNGKAVVVAKPEDLQNHRLIVMFF